MNDPEEQLLSAVASGDEAAFRLLYRGEWGEWGE